MDGEIVQNVLICADLCYLVVHAWVIHSQIKEFFDIVIILLRQDVIDHPSNIKSY